MKSLTCIIRRFSTPGSVVPYWYKSASQAADDGRNEVKIKSEWGGDVCEKAALEKRQEARKNSLDPMNGILKFMKEEPPSNLGKSVIIKVEKGTLIPSIPKRNNDVNKSKERLLTDEIGNIREIKKEKKSKKSSRRSKDLENDSRPSKHQKHNTSSSSSSSNKRDETTQNHHNSTHTAHNIPCTSTSNSTAIIALRFKRIEREYAERKRAAAVLAKVDIYGPLNVLQVGNLPDERTHRYNQQFHPNIAR